MTSLVYTCYIDPTQEGSKLAKKYLNQMPEHTYQVYNIHLLDMEKAPHWLNGTPLVVDMRNKTAIRGTKAVNALKDFAGKVQTPSPSPPPKKQQQRLQSRGGIITKTNQPPKSSAPEAAPSETSQFQYTNYPKRQSTESGDLSSDMNAAMSRRGQFDSMRRAMG